VSALVLATIVLTAGPAAATSSNRCLTIPGTNNGTITSNAWRTTGNGSVSGNTRLWDYQVSAVYSGTRERGSVRG
jgi:hypothetical protein